MAFYLGLCRLRGILPPPAPNDFAAGGPFFVVATTAAGGTILLCGSEEWNWTRTSLPLRPLQAELFSAALISKFDPEIKNRCTQKGVIGEKLASISKSGLEIKNRCTQKSINREKHASIRKFGPEIKNRCTQEGLKGEILASTQVRQWRQKRVLMRPEAAFPYVFAAEGAQHPPKKPPRSTVSRNGCRRNKPPRSTTLAAALPAAPAYASQHKKKRMTAVILLWYCVSRSGLALPDKSVRFGPPETLRIEPPGAGTTSDAQAGGSWC